MPLLEALIYGVRRVFDQNGAAQPLRSQIKFACPVSDDEANDWTLVDPTGGATSWQDGGASAATRTVRSGAGKFYQALGRNTGGSTVYLFFYDAVTKPSDTATTHLFAPIKLDAGEWFSLELERPRSLTTGLCWAASSTDASLTYASGATLNVATEYA